MFGLMKKGRPLQPGEWICPNPDCANMNFARRMQCNRCGEPRPKDAKTKKNAPIGKQFAEKSHGIHSPDDWSCSTCGNINWARRSECNLCQSPRFVKEEVREGVGGGFKENDNIEYKRYDSDQDEFDDFGRRKKKKYRKTGARDGADSRSRRGPHDNARQRQSGPASHQVSSTSTRDSVRDAPAYNADRDADGKGKEATTTSGDYFDGLFSDIPREDDDNDDDDDSEDERYSRSRRRRKSRSRSRSRSRDRYEAGNGERDVTDSTRKGEGRHHSNRSRSRSNERRSRRRSRSRSRSPYR